MMPWDVRMLHVSAQKLSIPNCDLDPDIQQYGPVVVSLAPTLIQKTVDVSHFLVGSNLTG
jgi:hypothetical protein